jgi:hypothetical protein
METSGVIAKITSLNRLKILPAIIGAGLLLGLTACDTTRQQTKGTIEPSGFLDDYSEMQPGVKDRANRFYLKPDVNWMRYTKIWIQPIEVWKSADPGSPMNKISHEDQQRLVNLFDTALVTALSTRYVMTDRPGPDVLIIHAAITDAKPSKPVAGFITSVYLPLKLVSFGKQSIAGTGIGVGSVTIEAEFLDGRTRARLAAVVDSRSGTSALRSKFDGTWGDVQNSFEWWANRLNTRLQELSMGNTEGGEP